MKLNIHLNIKKTSKDFSDEEVIDDFRQLFDSISSKDYSFDFSVIEEVEKAEVIVSKCPVCGCGGFIATCGHCDFSGGA